jgi:hypothetical protein
LDQVLDLWNMADMGDAISFDQDIAMVRGGPCRVKDLDIKDQDGRVIGSA